MVLRAELRAADTPFVQHFVLGAMAVAGAAARRQAAAVLVLIAVLSAGGGFNARCEAAPECAGPDCFAAGAPGEFEVEAEATGRHKDKAEESLECMVMASPGEDAEGRHPVWWLERGVPGHWSSGASVPVFEGEAANIVLMASNCQAAMQRLGCPARFDLGNHVTFSLDLPWLSAGKPMETRAVHADVIMSMHVMMMVMTMSVRCAPVSCALGPWRVAPCSLLFRLICHGALLVTR